MLPQICQPEVVNGVTVDQDLASIRRVKPRNQAHQRAFAAAAPAYQRNRFARIDGEVNTLQHIIKPRRIAEANIPEFYSTLDLLKCNCSVIRLNLFIEQVEYVLSRGQAFLDRRDDLA